MTDAPWTSAILRAWRARLGWTQRRAAEALGMHVASLKNVEAGKRSVTAALRRTAELLEAREIAPPRERAKGEKAAPPSPPAAPEIPTQAPAPRPALGATGTDADRDLVIAANRYAALALRRALVVPAERDLAAHWLNVAIADLNALIAAGGYSAEVMDAARLIMDPAKLVISRLNAANAEAKTAAEAKAAAGPAVAAWDDRDPTLSDMVGTLRVGGQGAHVLLSDGDLSADADVDADTIDLDEELRRDGYQDDTDPVAYDVRNGGASRTTQTLTRGSSAGGISLNNIPLLVCGPDGRPLDTSSDLSPPAPGRSRPRKSSTT